MSNIYNVELLLFNFMGKAADCRYDDIKNKVKAHTRVLI